jgi:hypothetical protein
MQERWRQIGLLRALPDGFHRIRHYGFLPTVIAPTNSPCAAGCSLPRLSHTPATTRIVSDFSTARRTDARAAAGRWSQSARFRDRRR